MTLTLASGAALKAHRLGMDRNSSYSFELELVKRVDELAHAQQLEVGGESCIL